MFALKASWFMLKPVPCIADFILVVSCNDSQLGSQICCNCINCVCPFFSLICFEPNSFLYLK
uniref:Uncharacterized protein n=1 Tax=Rhizophora mucronata TaxID=61149 RepID=A0A2P2PL23_RHIMU